jgi:hypothetical protein
MPYKPGIPFGTLRDETNAAEIAGHRPALVTRIQSEVPHEKRDPLDTLRGQPGEIYEDETYHHGMNTDKFNRMLREGLGTGRPDNIDTPDDGS